MKAILLWTCLLTTVFCDTTSLRSQPNFFFGNFQYRDSSPNYCVLANCCCPYGRISIKRDLTNSSQSLMTADMWVGEACQAMGLEKKKSRLIIPFKYSVSFDEMEISEGKFNNKGVKFSVNRAAKRPIYEGEDGVDFTLVLNYINAVYDGEECSVLLFKGSGMIKSIGGLFISVLMFVFLWN